MEENKKSRKVDPRRLTSNPKPTKKKKEKKERDSQKSLTHAHSFNENETQKNFWGAGQVGSEGEDRESVRASVETGKEMGLFGLLDAEELKKFEEGASPSSSSSPSPVLPTLTASSGGAFCLPSSNSVSSSEPLSASSPHFPTLSPTFSTSSPPSHPPAPPSSRKNDDGEGEKEAIRCIHQIMKNFAAQQKVMREKIKLQRDLIHLFEETKKQFTKIDRKLSSYAESVIQELVRQSDDGGVFADRLESLQNGLGKITGKKRLDVPQVQVAFYQIESAFRLKRTQNLAMRTHGDFYPLPMGGGEEMGEGGEEDMGWQSLMALAEVKKGAAGGQPKGFLSMLGRDVEDEMGAPKGFLDMLVEETAVSQKELESHSDISVSPETDRRPSPLPSSVNSPSASPLLAPPSPTSLSPSTHSKSSSPRFYSSSRSSTQPPPSSSSSPIPPSSSPIPPSSLSPSSSVPPAFRSSQSFSSSGSTEDFNDLKRSPKKKETKQTKKEKKAIKIHLHGSSSKSKIQEFKRRDSSSKGIEKKASSPTDRKELKREQSEPSTGRLSRRHEEEEKENNLESDYDFTKITLSGLLFFILEIAPVTSRFRRNFLSTFTLFATAEDVISFLKEYLSDQPEVDQEALKKRTLAVVLFVKRWIEERFATIKEENALESLQALIVRITALQPLVSSTLERILSQQLTNEPVDELKNHKTFDFPDLSWDKFNVVELCESICYEEFLLYKKITLDELLYWNSSKKRDQKCSNIRAICNFSNHLASWVCTEMVKRAKLSERVFLLRKFVNMAEMMLEMNNFSSCMSILGGLNSSPIARLKMTWKEAGKDTFDQFERMNQIMSWKGSYSVYREYLKGVVPPCLPFLGMHLTDLTFISDGNVDPDNTELINFSKWEMMAEILTSVRNYQQFEYSRPEKKVNCLEAFAVGPWFDEDKLYEYSNIVEPKGGTEESKEILMTKYQELQDRLQKALEEIEVLKQNQKKQQKEEETEEEENTKPPTIDIKIV